MRIVTDNMSRDHLLVRFAPAWIGACAGLAYCLLLFPIDTVKSKMQADSLTNPQYIGTVDCIRQTLKKYGMRGLYRGVAVGAARAVPT